MHFLLSLTYVIFYCFLNSIKYNFGAIQTFFEKFFLNFSPQYFCSKTVGCEQKIITEHCDGFIYFFKGFYSRCIVDKTCEGFVPKFELATGS